MRAFAETILELLAFFVFVVIAPLLTIAGGMLVGWIVGLFGFVADPVHAGLAAIGVADVPLWQLGGGLAFLSIPLSRLIPGKRE